MRKILCDGVCRGERCGKWLARVEDGYVYIRCPRCRSYHKEPLIELLLDLEELVDELRDTAQRAGVKVPARRKVFG